jgi:HCOMODA/2-hydroxy-3-carboxy-muconic semialdehyde decarboxylase
VKLQNLQGRLRLNCWPILRRQAEFLPARGVVDGFGHVSMRHPDSPDRFLMSKSIAPALVVPDDIIEYDLNSEPCNANGRGSFLERFIHGEIYKARPDINSVVHSHSPSVIPVWAGANRYEGNVPQCCFLGGGCSGF